MNKLDKITTETTAVGDAIRHAGDKAAQKSDELIHRGGKMAGTLQKEAGEYTDVVVDYIKKYPVKSALIAVAAGVILGRIIKS